MAEAEQKQETKKDGLWETLKVIIHALILALIVRTFLFQPFNIPSGSMENTLLVGDYLFVSKYSYGYSKYSFPFAIIPFSGRIWSAEPQQGDIAVFRLPRDPSQDYIKRVIGVPGDKIQVTKGVLYINGKAVKRERVKPSEIEERGYRRPNVPTYRETLPNGVSYLVLDSVQGAPSDDTGVYEVPEGHYFMMGDNRDNSTDSRVAPEQGGVGMVPFENFIGRASVIFFSVDSRAPAWQFWRWPWTARWDRIFTGL